MRWAKPSSDEGAFALAGDEDYIRKKFTEPTGT
jgi:hypothetical protein